ncbi:hypothetical protein LOK49_LG13G01271 [Camellia lanceoleosa]|uniref:Uncharacterized protein n=1 Tax=Camellia lanceoleosa TaxID=1840588 RepID=A0ACC0FH67_9ERIC|nr:hypothetical protein LOK49_LG13G01271 [Camellia lanceoleosa]
MFTLEATMADCHNNGRLCESVRFGALPSIPLQLMDQHQKHDENEIEEGESGDDEEFRILGHSMFLKRRRDGESVASCSSSSKRVSIERLEAASRFNRDE